MSTILDLGCGDGRITAFLASKLNHGKITGVDNSQDMVEHAIAVHQGVFDNLDFIHADAAQFKLNEKFDHILCFNCLHWIQQQDYFFDSVAAHLKDNGRFYAVVYPAAEPFWTALDEVIHSSYWQEYFISYINPYNFQNMEGYKKLLNNAKLTQHQIVQKEKIATMKTIEDFKNYTLTWLPHFTAIPKLLEQDFLNDLARVYLSLNNQSADLSYQQIDIMASFSE